MESKQEKYDDLILQISSLIEGEKEETSILANVSAALKQAFGWFWVGFYLERQGELRLGPFQGTVACMHIANGKGVCGTAYSRKESIVVDDVEQFPGHIACSSLSRSEIVIPIFKKADNNDIADTSSTPVGVLDIDSTELSAFDDTDRQNLERLCAIISKTLY